jgi:hypothetical protein
MSPSLHRFPLSSRFDPTNPWTFACRKTRTTAWMVECVLPLTTPSGSTTSIESIPCEEDFFGGLRHHDRADLSEIPERQGPLCRGPLLQRRLPSSFWLYPVPPDFWPALRTGSLHGSTQDRRHSDWPRKRWNPNLRDPKHPQRRGPRLPETPHYNYVNSPKKRKEPNVSVVGCLRLA